MASKIFNGTTVSGRANVAKATYASIAVLYIVYRLKNRGKGNPPPSPPPTTSPPSLSSPSDSTASHGSNCPDCKCAPDPRCAPDHGPNDSNGNSITGTAVAAAAADAYINSTSNQYQTPKHDECD